jgi:hypothetical protein
MDGFTYTVNGDRYEPPSGWLGAQTIDGPSGVSSGIFPAVALDGFGNGEAVWSRSDGVGSNVLARRYTAGGGWAPGGFIGERWTGSAVIAGDATGAFVAAWFHNPATGVYRIGAAVGDFDGWDAPTLLDDVAGMVVNVGGAAMDGSGNAVVVWEQRNSNQTRFRVWARRYIEGIGWAAPEPISPDDGVDASGRATVVWTEDPGVTGQTFVWARRFE